MGISTAQKVRLWFMLAATIIQLVALVYLGSLPQVTMFGIPLMNGSRVNAGLGWAGIGFLADAVLGPITLWRFLSPKVKAVPGSAAAYNQEQPQWPAQQFAQVQYPPQSPYQHPGPRPYPQTGRHGRPEGSDQ